jgi:hypothetical protein
VNWDIKVVTTNFKVALLELPGGSEEHMKYFHQGNHLLRQELKPLCPKHEGEMPTTNPTLTLVFKISHRMDGLIEFNSPCCFLLNCTLVTNVTLRCHSETRNCSVLNQLLYTDSLLSTVSEMIYHAPHDIEACMK